MQILNVGKIIVATLEELRKKGQSIDVVMICGIASSDNFAESEFKWNWSSHFLNHDFLMEFHWSSGDLYNLFIAYLRLSL